MNGGLLQLAAYGAQDIYLTVNPDITFFNHIYRRHTNFAVEDIEDDKKTNVMKYYKYEKYVKECAICYSDFEPHDTVEVPLCGHCFHHHCLQQWFETSRRRSCPMCRGIIPKSGELEEENCCTNDSSVTWVDGLGHSLIDNVSVEIGGQIVDRPSREWLDTWNELNN